MFIKFIQLYNEYKNVAYKLLVADIFNLLMLYLSSVIESLPQWTSWDSSVDPMLIYGVEKFSLSWWQWTPASWAFHLDVHPSLQTTGMKEMIAWCYLFGDCEKLNQKFTVEDDNTKIKIKSQQCTMQSLERCVRSMAVIQMTQSVAWFLLGSHLL